MNKTVFKGRVEAVGDAPLRRVVALLGGWPVVDKNWKGDNFVIEEVLGLVRANFTSNTILFCSVAADDKNSSSNIIQVTSMSSVNTTSYR